MKKYPSIVLFLISLYFYPLIGCQKNNSPAQDVPASTTKKDTTTTVASDSIKVTFIELGSVKCIPCKMMQPIMDDIKNEYPGQVKVVFHDVWTEKGKPFAEQYRISAIPTQIFLDQEGNEYFRHTGFFPKEELVQVLKQKGVQ